MIEPVLAQARTPEGVLGSLMASLDSYTGDDPMSVLFVETYLAASRDPVLREAVAVADPETTAAVLGAAVDGLVMQRALDPALTAEAVGPVLNRMLTPIDENTGGRT